MGEGGLCEGFEFNEGGVFEEKVVKHGCTPVGVMDREYSRGGVEGGVVGVVCFGVGF